MLVLWQQHASILLRNAWRRCLERLILHGVARGATAGVEGCGSCVHVCGELFSRQVCAQLELPGVWCVFGAASSPIAVNTVSGVSWLLLTGLVRAQLGVDAAFFRAL